MTVELQATAQSVTTVDCVQVALLVAVVLVGFSVSCGSSGGASFDGGASHSPATVTPKIWMHGRWNLGSSGNSGQANSTPAMAGRPHMMIAAHSGQGRMTGTIVVEESLPVVVSHSFEVKVPVNVSVDRPGGTVVMVEVTNDVVTGAVPETGVTFGTLVLPPGDGTVVVEPSTMTAPLDASETVCVASVNGAPPA